jgi:hypothetical protein
MLLIFRAGGIRGRKRIFENSHYWRTSTSTKFMSHMAAKNFFTACKDEKKEKNVFTM